MSSEEVPILSKEEAIKETIRQVEFYFADANLPFDKFLWTLTRKDNGWVPISTLASFKRMKPMRNALNDQELAEAIKSSTNDLLEVDEKGEKVRRKKELVKQTGAFDRSIYAKGFPINETPQLQPDLERYFAEFGKINSVRFRRADPSKVSSEYPPKAEEAAGATSTEASTSTSTSEPAKKEESTSKNNKSSKWPFKGSVFVEFSSKEEQEAFLEKAKSEPESLKYEGKTLEIMSKKDYCDMKIKEKGINPEDAYKREGGDFDGKKTTGRTNLSGKTSGFNAFKEMEKEEKFGSSSNNKNSEEEKKKRQEELEKKLNEDLEFDFNGVKLISNSKGEIDSETIPIPKNTVLSFKNVGDGKEGDWKTLKDDLNKVQKPKFVEFPEGSKEGKVAFHDEINDETLEKIKGLEIKLGGNVIEWEKVNDEDSTTFYKERAHFRAKFMLQKREEELKSGGAGGGSSSSRGGGRGRGGRGGNSGGRGGRGRGNRGGSRGGGGAGRDTRSGNKRDREESDQGSGGNKKAKTEA